MIVICLRIYDVKVIRYVMICRFSRELLLTLCSPRNFEARMALQREHEEAVRNDEQALHDLEADGDNKNVPSNDILERVESVSAVDRHGRAH